MLWPYANEDCQTPSIFLDPLEKLSAKFAVVMVRPDWCRLSFAGKAGIWQGPDEHASVELSVNTMISLQFGPRKSFLKDQTTDFILCVQTLNEFVMCVLQCHSNNWLKRLDVQANYIEGSQQYEVSDFGASLLPRSALPCGRSQTQLKPQIHRFRNVNELLPLIHFVQTPETIAAS